MNEIPGNMISLIPNNGTEFPVKAGQKVIFEVPPDVGFVKGRDSYLSFDVLNTGSERIGMNNTAGANSLINRLDIYSLKTGTHLETLENLNQWCGIENQYFYEDPTNLTSLEGCGTQVFAQDVEPVVTTDGELVPHGLLADQVADTLLSPIRQNGRPVYQFRRYTIPLRAGLFRWWDDERLCPIIALGGLRVVITLEDPKVCFSRLKPTVLQNMKLNQFDANRSLEVEAPNDATMLTGGYFFLQEKKDTGLPTETQPAGRTFAKTGLNFGQLIQVWDSANPATADAHTAAIEEVLHTGYDLTVAERTVSCDDITSPLPGTITQLVADGTVVALEEKGFYKGSLIDISCTGATSGTKKRNFYDFCHSNKCYTRKGRRHFCWYRKSCLRSLGP